MEFCVRRSRCNYFIFLHLFILLWAQVSHGRWAVPADANSKILTYRAKMQVAVSSSTTDTEIVTEILKEGGRDQGTFRYSYNPETTSVKVIEAYTVLNKQRYTVAANAIVNKPVQLSTQGFDQLNELVITFPRVEIGSRTHLKLRVVVRKYPLRMFTWRWLPSGWGLIENVSIDVTSKIPLFSELNNPREVLQLTKSDKTPWRYLLVNKKPLFESVADEAQPILNEKILSWWKLSEVPTYADLPARVLPDYEKVINSPLTELHTSILANAKGESITDKVNALTTGLQEKMRYMGDWRGVRGTHVPRPFAEVTKHASGDCKDYAASMVAMLRSLKLNAYPALVASGERGAPELGQVPYENVFNHVIVMLEHEGKTYWIDPTDPRSFAQGIPPHVLDRPALVLNPTGAKVERIPAVSPQPYRFENTILINAENLEKLEVDAEIQGLMGGAYWWTLWSQYASPESIQRSIAQQFYEDQELESFSFAPLDFSKHVVTDTRVKGKMRIRPQLVNSSQGKGLYVRHLNVVGDLAGLAIRDRISDYFWTSPVEVRRTIEIKGQKISGRKLEGCRIESAWFNYERLYESRRSSFLVQEQMQTQKSHIEAAEMQTPNFKAAFEALKSCTQRVVLIF